MRRNKRGIKQKERKEKGGTISKKKGEEALGIMAKLKSCRGVQSQVLGNEKKAPSNNKI